MKTLKKHPKQQRMEEMNIPGSFVTMTGTSKRNRCEVKIKEVPYGNYKVEWTKDRHPREFLRSINDDNGFTLMPRIVWRVVAVGVLVGAVIYFMSKAL